MSAGLVTAAFGASFAMALVSAIVLAWRGARGSAQGPLLAALAATLLWSATLSALGSSLVISSFWLNVVEMLRYTLWILALRALWPAGVPSRVFRAAMVSSIGLLLLGIVAVVADSASPGSLPWFDEWILSGHGGLVLACLGVVLVEQVLRNAPPGRHGAARLVALGVGGQFAYDLFIYSQAELVGAVSAAAWAMRGVVVSLLLPITVLGFNRHVRDEPRLFVSRQVVFYATAFVALGAYLLVMSVGGYYVRRHGGTWGESLQILFVVGAGVVLAAVLLSDTVWRQLRVFIAKHFYRNKYDHRVEWLRFVRTLSAGEDADIRASAIRAVAQILRSPGGFLFLRSESAEVFEAVAQWSDTNAVLAAPPSIGVAAEMTSFLADRNWVIDLEECRHNPGLYRNITLPEWLLDPRLSWRIVTPLLRDHSLVGFLVLRSPPSSFEMTFEDRDVLQMAGRHVAVLLAQQQSDQRLADSRQFDAFNRFAAFVMHDLKNSVAQLQLLVNNAAKHRDNPEFMDDAISTIANTVERMTRLIEQLRARDLHGQQRDVDLSELLSGLAGRAQARLPAPTVAPQWGAQPLRVTADPERLAAVLDHVVRNAQEAAGAQGSVTVDLSHSAGRVAIAVTDTGPGMEARFVRDRLFKPFDSTKGSKGMGIGAYQAREYVRQLGGEVEVQSSPGSGTRFLITLPLCLTKN